MTRTPTPEPMHGYIPPQDIPAEQATLGAMLLDADAREIAASALTASDFYVEAHGDIFDTLLALARDGRAVDLLTLQAALLAAGKTGPHFSMPYLAELPNVTPTTLHLADYVQTIREKAQRRGMVAAARHSLSLACDAATPIDDALALAEGQFADIANGRAVGLLEPVRCSLSRIWDAADERAQNPGDFIGVPVGLPAVDNLTGGLQKSDLIILAARPSMGKTACALTMAQTVAARGLPVAVFSLEMTTDQLVTRLVCSEAELSSAAMRCGRLSQDEWSRLGDAQRKFYDAPLHLCDKAALTVSQMRAECRRLQRESLHASQGERGLSLVIVDYLQLMRGEESGKSRTENRTQEITEIARGLKTLARDLNVPVVALSQLSRAVEQRENKRPLLSDLRESGAIEQDADIVAFLYRASYYARRKDGEAFSEEGAVPDDGAQMEQTEFIVAKHRNGPTKTIRLGFVPRYTKFLPWPEAFQQTPEGGTS